MPRSFALMPNLLDPAIGPSPAVSDETLIARARAGERHAFGQLVERHYDFIFRTACKWAGARSDAEDIAQEVCIKLATAIGSFDGRSAFTSWLYRVTVNAVRDMQRARGRRGRNVDRFAEVSPESALPDQEEATAAGEVWAAVDRLPEKQRMAVILVYAEDKSHAEAAAFMGCKESTVSWHLHEARKSLRGLL